MHSNYQKKVFTLCNYFKFIDNRTLKEPENYVRGCI